MLHPCLAAAVRGGVGAASAVRLPRRGLTAPATLAFEPFKAHVRRDMMAAMKARQSAEAQLLKALVADLTYAEKAGQAAAAASAAPLLQQAIKRRRESAAAYAANGRADLAEKEEREAALLGAYLPAPLATDALEALIRSVGSTNMGAIMKHPDIVSAVADGRVDRKVLSQVAKRLLAA
ncbi:hypothetical protein CXG81DRAFT_27101 [Caulochytrium protostelioides]|uniref:Altered inheritance of mitochondria protein 41 n=1 Tax=Caulochytrium protostelioides TaxID=1555241 RepID=A0A4P9X4Z9_9FUNG|nr:hypothetical protein CXG81DRAFT_27101 [Caulochytrium protostelioides]|eukprot:RKP00173.1 hypothetical protein CXG81DRAFT_27101 [Caulochytrium protostelioides]